MKSLKNDTIIYCHFENTGYSPSKVLIQPVEKIIYDSNSSSKLKKYRIHEIDLKWIQFCNHPFL